MFQRVERHMVSPLNWCKSASRVVHGSWKIHSVKLENSPFGASSMCVFTRENTTALPQAPAGLAGGVGVDRVATAPAMVAAARAEADSMDMAASYAAEAIAAAVRRAEVEIIHMGASAEPEARTTFEQYAYASCGVMPAVTKDGDVWWR
jgi:hypothetical protein